MMTREFSDKSNYPGFQPDFRERETETERDRARDRERQRQIQRQSEIERDTERVLHNSKRKS